MLVVIAFCMLVISYILLKDKDSGVAEMAVAFAFLTIGAVTGSYVFGAAWQDISLDRNKGGPHVR